jgi:uncharacterized protein (TIGR00725 family)
MITCAALIVVLLTVPTTSTGVLVVTALAVVEFEPSAYVVDELSFTVTFWPSVVVIVKVEPDTAVTVPEVPPGSGPDRAFDSPPVAPAAGKPCPGAAVDEDAAVVVLFEDEPEVAARPMETPATTHTAAAPLMTMFRLRENHDRFRGCCALGSASIMMSFPLCELLTQRCCQWNLHGEWGRSVKTLRSAACAILASMPLQVAVCGPSVATPEEIAHAAEIGRLLAERGAVVICGGYGGVMGAVAQGAAEAGGLVVGVLSGRDRAGASPHLSVALPTGLGEARNNLVAQSGDALIAVGGSWGTLSEIALAVRRGTARVISLDGWRVLDPDGTVVPGIHYASSPQAAVDAALN